MGRAGRLWSISHLLWTAFDPRSRSSGSTGRGHEMQGAVGPVGVNFTPFGQKITIRSQEKALNITYMSRINSYFNVSSG